MSLDYKSTYMKKT